MTLFNVSAFTYNALGQMKTVTDASGTRAIDYAADAQLSAETLAFNTSLFTLHEKFDTLGRNAGYALSNEVAQITGTMQSFDLYGRLNQVAVDGISGDFTYGYLEGSHLQKTLAMPNGVTRYFGYEPNRDLLTMIIHSNTTERLVQRDFTFDGFGRLIDRTLVRASGSSSSAPDAFGYNIRSELTNSVIGANAFAYNFDPIGNRKEATEFGTNTAYTASALNQYTSITNSVNSVPLCEINPEFDLDGNQTLIKTSTGIWNVSYNAENRPMIFSNSTTVVSMAYDYMGRRFEYKEFANGTLTRHERYLYRGYLQLAALDMLNSASVKHAIVWDASEPTATRPLCLSLPTCTVYYSFDQVKNVTELFDSSGALAATYDYSPFGQLVASTGNVANPLTFSSEISDSTLGLQYYNYRHLNTLDGRWVNRDPIGEEGGIALYAYVGNETENIFDFLGLESISGVFEEVLSDGTYVRIDVERHAGMHVVVQPKNATKCTEYTWLGKRFEKIPNSLFSSWKKNPSIWNKLKEGLLKGKKYLGAVKVKTPGIVFEVLSLNIAQQLGYDSIDWFDWRLPERNASCNEISPAGGCCENWECKCPDGYISLGGNSSIKINSESKPKVKCYHPAEAKRIMKNMV